MKAYDQSKLALVLFTKELAKRLGPDSTVHTYSLHPGAVDTKLVETFIYKIIIHIYRNFLISPLMGAQTILFCALEPTLDNESGFYYE